MLEHLLSRTDRSLLGRWWWTIDRWTFLCIFTLFIVGIFLSFSASPSVAHTIHLPTFYFVQRHVIFTFLSLFLMVGVSLNNPNLIRLLCWLILGTCIVMLMLTPIIGMEIKGARRWINLFGFSLQASEFVKPTFAVATAWLLSKHIDGPLSGRMLSVLLYASILLLIIIQPDFGMAFVITGIWFFQFFLAGLPLMWVSVLSSVGLAGSIGAYFLFPHVASRVDRFLNPAAGDHFQIERSLQAFRNGGWFGRGPGEGLVKKNLPDAHADFVFSVAGEEFGLFACLFILGLFLFFILRGFYFAHKEHNSFLSLAISGLFFQIALQAIVNISSSLHLIPTKGMTLPFLSYGGSSLLSIGLSAGILLSFTKKRLDDKHI
ncbi:MAG: putative peptidoglycan glycosyltransferase FtsW [Alphaproteobacteria bacterium]